MTVDHVLCLYDYTLVSHDQIFSPRFLTGNMTHAFHQLRRQRLLSATRPFKARGHALVRCPDCLLGLATCICHEQKICHSQVDFVLLMHRDEILKPTNTGRLIADILPHNTQAFCWQRQAPPAEFQQVLDDPTRMCVIIFPAAEVQSSPYMAHKAQASGLKLTFILLDGTWKQARKMYNSCPWLQVLPCVSCPEAAAGAYSLRQAAHAGCLSTAEAAIAVLKELRENPAADQLATYFHLFNQRYLSTRGLRPKLDTQETPS